MPNQQALEGDALTAYIQTMRVGYGEIFEDYQLKVLTPIRTYGKYDRAEAPTDIADLSKKG